jgi:hypothetical protein
MDFLWIGKVQRIGGHRAECGYDFHTHRKLNENIASDACSMTLSNTIVHLVNSLQESKVFSRFTIAEQVNNADQAPTATACLSQLSIDCETVLAHNSGMK